MSASIHEGLANLGARPPAAVLLLGCVLLQQCAPGGGDGPIQAASSCTDLLESARYEEAVEVCRQAVADQEREAPGSLLLSESLEALGRVALARGEYNLAEENLRRSLALRERLAPGGLSEASVIGLLGRVALLRGELDSAGELLGQALETYERLEPDGLGAAAVVNDLGILARRRGELETAAELHQQALEIRQASAPESLAVADSYNGLGLVVWRRGDLDEAETLLRRALEIRQKLAPGSTEIAKSLSNLGNLSYGRGELAEAERYYRQAAEIWERVAPGSAQLAIPLDNLGAIAKLRGDLVAAEQYILRALDIQEDLTPADAASSLNNLGAVALDRGDPSRAESYLQRALEIRERLTPDGLPIVSVLNNLALVALAEDSPDVAEELTRRGVAIRDRQAPSSQEAAHGHNQLAELIRQRGDLAEAEREFRLALGVGKRAVPGSPTVAASLLGLGRVAAGRGRLDEALDFHRRALEIRERRRPGTTAEAESRRALAELALQAKDRSRAVEWLYRSLESLEAQYATLGGRVQVRAEFAAERQGYYQRLIGLLLELGRLEEAFEVVERSRAQLLRAMLAERDLDLAGEMPPALDRERKQVELAYDRAQARIAQLSPVSDADEIEQLSNRQRDLRERLARLRQDIRRQSPRLAALQYPQPLDLAQARRTLDPGTLFLSYVVAEDASWLFVVSPPGRDPGLSVHPLSMNREELSRRVSIFRSFIERSRGDTEADPALLAQGERLFQELAGPATEAIRHAERILISSDGPLHMLPFSALVSRRGGTGDAASSQYFVEWKPLHRVVSATVYEELQRMRSDTTRQREPDGLVVAAFGDPDLPSVDGTASSLPRDAQLRALASPERGFDLGPLPHSRAEVRAIGELYGKRARVHVGKAATEEQAKQLGTSARILHFATHSLLDERFPLNSALVLSLDEEWRRGSDNGLLQAWEIFERMRLAADLVTLSACQTAVGKELGGEGLMGLARAFQFAGARSVVASLWSVSDRSTTELMKHFYSHLEAGESRDEALRAAQLELISGRDGPAARAPFHWAAFQLMGDWR